MEEQIPNEFHDFLDVFSEEKAAHFLESRPWDHKIKLKDTFTPKSFKTYNLTPQEQIKLDKFLKGKLGQRLHLTFTITNWISIFILLTRKMENSDLVKIINTLMNIWSRMPTPYHWSANSWTNSKEHDDSLNWMFSGDTIMSGSEMGTNGKQPSKQTEDFLNQQWCSLECVTHQQHFKQWWMILHQMKRHWWKTPRRFILFFGLLTGVFCQMRNINNLKDHQADFADK